MIKSWPVHSGRNVTAAPFKVGRENLNKKLPSALSVVGHLSIMLKCHDEWTNRNGPK